jgi:hypothetical protein
VIGSYVVPLADDEIADQGERLARAFAKDAVSGIGEHLEAGFRNRGREFSYVLGRRDRIELTTENESRRADRSELRDEIEAVDLVAPEVDADLIVPDHTAQDVRVARVGL